MWHHGFIPSSLFLFFFFSFFLSFFLLFHIHQPYPLLPRVLLYLLLFFTSLPSPPSLSSIALPPHLFLYFFTSFPHPQSLPSIALPSLLFIYFFFTSFPRPLSLSSMSPPPVLLFFLLFCIHDVYPPCPPLLHHATRSFTPQPRAAATLTAPGTATRISTHPHSGHYPP